MLLPNSPPRISEHLTASAGSVPLEPSTLIILGLRIPKRIEVHFCTNHALLYPTSAEANPPRAKKPARTNFKTVQASNMIHVVT